MKRGLLPFKPDTVPLKFGAYLNQNALPQLPSGKFGHALRAQPPRPWGMLGNDRYGDCVMVAAAHDQMLWAWATGKRLPEYSDQTIVKQYLKLTGGKDTGLDMVSTAQWRQSTGLTDSNGVVSKIAAFAEVRTTAEIALAAYIFGLCDVGFALPKNAEEQFVSGEPWSDTSGDPSDGHCVPCVGRNSSGLLMFVSWGRLQAATDRWIARYFMGGIAYMSKDYMTGEQASPESISWDQLAADLSAL
jgi:hypothetical protein